MLLSNKGWICYLHILQRHTRTWLRRKRRVLIWQISFGNCASLLWMSDPSGKLYWDPLRDDRWDLSLRARRGAAGDTWYVIRRWCHGCRWLPFLLLLLIPVTRVEKWQHCEQHTENFYLPPSVWSQARWSWIPAIATFMPFRKKKKEEEEDREKWEREGKEGAMKAVQACFWVLGQVSCRLICLCCKGLHVCL